jgi:hypothetical protein
MSLPPETVADSINPPCNRPGCCVPGTPQQITAVRIELELAKSKRDQAADDVEREHVVTELGQYLFDQMKAYPQLADWIAGDLIAHLVRVGKRPDMPGAIRALIDTTSDVEALVAFTPADPPSPPASTTTGRDASRARWWSLHRASIRYLSLVAGVIGLVQLWTWWVQR